MKVTFEYHHEINGFLNKLFVILIWMLNTDYIYIKYFQRELMEMEMETVILSKLQSFVTFKL